MHTPVTTCGSTRLSCLRRPAAEPGLPNRSNINISIKSCTIQIQLRKCKVSGAEGAGRGGGSLLGDEAEAHLEEGGDHGRADEGAVALLPAGVARAVSGKREIRTAC